MRLIPSSRVSLACDLTMPLTPPLITSHGFVPLPPAVVPPPGICPCLEMPVTVMWSPGFALFENRLTTTVLHRGMPFALDGHNCGVLIPHVSYPPTNMLLPLIVMFSSRKMAFAASTVKANGAQIACTTVTLLPMTCCASPVTMPTGAVPLNLLNSVITGMTWGDVLAGALGLAINMLFEYITHETPSAPTLVSVFEKLFWPRSLVSLKTVATKAAIGALTGVARIAITGEGSIAIKVGTDYAGVWVSSTRTADGKWTRAGGAQGGALLPTGEVRGQQLQLSVVKSPDGSTSTTWSGSYATGEPTGFGGTAHRESISHTTDTAPSGRRIRGNKIQESQAVVSRARGGSEVNIRSVTPTDPLMTPMTTRSGYEGGNFLGNIWGVPL